MAGRRHKGPSKKTARQQGTFVNRRTLLKGLTIGAGALAAAEGAGTVAVRWLARSEYRPRFLTEKQFETLQAACERILPADDEPGARTIGAAIYIDRLLAEDP